MREFESNDLCQKDVRHGINMKHGTFGRFFFFFLILKHRASLLTLTANKIGRSETNPGQKLNVFPLTNTKGVVEEKQYRVMTVSCILYPCQVLTFCAF
jgi:hypothetical protein